MLSFYISIFSSVCFVTSEILPFLPVNGNGIVHAILECLSSYNKNTPPGKDKEIEISNKLDQDIEKLDKIQDKDIII